MLNVSQIYRASTSFLVWHLRALSERERESYYGLMIRTELILREKETNPTLELHRQSEEYYEKPVAPFE